MTKTAKVSKEVFNYLRDNDKEAKLVLKSLEKRRKKDLSIELDNSSQLSQSAIVEVDLTAMKPVVLDGEIAIRDMPVEPRKRKLVTPEPEQDEEDLNEDEQSVEEEEQDLGNNTQDEQEEEEQDQIELENDTIILSQKLQDIADNVYDAIIGSRFNPNISHVRTISFRNATRYCICCFG